MILFSDYFTYSYVSGINYDFPGMKCNTDRHWPLGQTIDISFHFLNGIICDVISGKIALYQ